MWSNAPLAARTSSRRRERPAPRHLRFLSAVACFLATTTFGDVSAGQVKSFPVEVPYWPGSIHWLDHSRIVVAALSKPSAGDPPRPLLSRPTRLAVIDVQTDQITWGEMFNGQLC